MQKENNFGGNGKRPHPNIRGKESTLYLPLSLSLCQSLDVVSSHPSLGQIEVRFMVRKLVTEVIHETSVVEDK